MNKIIGREKIICGSCRYDWRAACQHAERPNAVWCPDYEKRFGKLINEDLNIPEALALMWKLVRDSRFSSTMKLATLLKMDRVFGLGLSEVERGEVPEEVEELVQERERMRREENWGAADELRDRIDQAGFTVEDTEKGPVVKRARVLMVE